MDEHFKVPKIRSKMLMKWFVKKWNPFRKSVTFNIAYILLYYIYIMSTIRRPFTQITFYRVLFLFFTSFYITAMKMWDFSRAFYYVARPRRALSHFRRQFTPPTRRRKIFLKSNLCIAVVIGHCLRVLHKFRTHRSN